MDFGCLREGDIYVWCNAGHASQSNSIAVIIILILIGRKVTDILGIVRELNFFYQPGLA